MDEKRLTEIEEHLRWMRQQTAVHGQDLIVGVAGALEVIAELRRLRANSPAGS
jgi:gamma-glutamyl:cysteine ligase YbdK (ATP-grasp superfamily)